MAAFALCVAIAHAAEGRPRVSEEAKRLGYSETRLISKPKPGIDAAELATRERQESVRLAQPDGPPHGIRVLEATGGESIAEVISRLRATGNYEFVEPDFLVKADATPNDPRFLGAEQWALRNIGQDNGTAGADIRAEEGWDIQSSAASVIVAIIDSGLRRTHEDLAANLWVNPGESGGLASNGRDDDGNGYIDDVNGINSTVARTSTASGAPTDADGHGSAVASVIGAVGNNGVGMTGVAWQVKLMPLRFLDTDGLGFVSDEIECIDYAIAKGARIINASFGNASFSQSLFDALKRARDAGIIVVCSAGNDADNSDLSPHYPSGYLLENIISVANTTRSDALSTTSAYGSGLVDLGAPGSSILVASDEGDRSYRVVSGTSFSAPMVSGALALLKAKFPNDSYRESINRLLRGTESRPALAGKTATGGRLNLAAALRTTDARPFNDDFVRRASLSGENVTARASAQNATRESGEPVHGGTAGNGSLWWTWTAPRSGSVTFDTAGSAPDTLLSVYTGANLAALSAVASNDNEPSSAITSKVTFTAVAGTAYHVAVDCKTNAGGLVLLRLALVAGNDEFVSAQSVSGRSWSIRSDNRTATRESGEPRIRNNAGGSSVWFKWTAPVTRRYHIASMSSDFNTMLGIYTGTSVSALAEIAAVTTAGDSNFTMNSAGTTLSATAGTTYYIVIDSEVSSSGAKSTGEFTLACIDSDWEFFGTGPLGTPAIAPDGSIVAADDFGDIHALNSDGSSKWRYTMTGYGTFSAPAIAPDGTIYVGDDFNYLHALTPAGARKWRILTGGIVQSSPAIATDGTIYMWDPLESTCRHASLSIL